MESNLETYVKSLTQEEINEVKAYREKRMATVTEQEFLLDRDVEAVE